MITKAPLLYIYYKNRNISGSTWSSATEIAQNSIAEEGGKLDMAVTADDKMHMVYGYTDLYYREWDDGTMSSSYDVMDVRTGPRISGNGNDVYVICITDDGSSGYELRMRQRDFAPLAPTNLSVSGGWLENPTLSWDANTEPDLDEYNIYRAEPGSVLPSNV